MATLLLGIWLALVGVDWAGWASIDHKLLGIFAFIVGILLLVDGLRR